jgi:hypothetical protein
LQSKYTAFISLVVKTIEFYTPLKRATNSSSLPYNIHKLYKRKNQLFKEYHSSIESRSEYKIVVKQIKKALSRIRCNREEEILTSENKSDFYRHIKNVMKPFEEIPSLIRDNELPAFSNFEKCNVFASQFRSVYDDAFDNQTNANAIATQQLPHKFPVTNCLFEFPPFLVSDYLSKLPNKFSITEERLNQFQLKNLAISLAFPLSILFQESFDTSCIPQQWKTAWVIPVFKKGSRNDASNYRPISLTSPICRVMERIIATKIRFSFSNRLTMRQYGFHRKKSCNVALLDVCSQWQKLLKQKKNIDVIYFDFLKAFDNVPRKELLEKLVLFGFDSQLCKWFKQFLSDRTSRVRIGDDFSTPFPVLSGVLQGTVTGPLLFLIFINDISSIFQSLPDVHFALFADDLKVYGCNPTQMQDCINRLYQWSIDWKLPLALHKTNVLHIGKTNRRQQYQIHNFPIEAVTVMRDLGVLIDDKLSFEPHINQQIAKANAIATLILKAFSFRSPEKYISLFFTYVVPILEYCSEIYCPRVNSVLAARLEQPLRRFSAFVFQRCRCPYDSYNDRLVQSNVKPLYYRRISIDLVQMFKIVFGYSDINVHFFDFSSSPRHPFRVRFPPNIYKDDNFFVLRAIRYWNIIAPDINRFQTIDSFKQFLNDNREIILPDIPRSFR